MAKSGSRKNVDREWRGAYASFLRQTMEGLGMMRQLDFAEWLGFDNSTVSLHLGGKRTPSAQSKSLLASKLGIDVGELESRIREHMGKVATHDQEEPTNGTPVEESEEILIRDVRKITEEMSSVTNKYLETIARIAVKLLSKTRERWREMT